MIFIDLMGKDISFITVFVIMWGLVSWGIGQNLAKAVFKKRTDFHCQGIIKYYKIPSIIVFICTAIILVTVTFAYKYFIKIGESFGGGNFLAAYGAARAYMLEIQNGNMSVEIHKPSLLTLFEMLASSISYYFLYVFLYNKFICKVQNKILLIPILCYLPILFFTTSRMAFLSVICFTIGIYMTLLYSVNPIRKANKKIFKMLLPILIIGALIFKVGGAMRTGALSEEGMTGETSTASTDLCMYVASNIYALNYFLDGKHEFDFGAKTLSGVRQVLGRLGVQFKTRPRHYENVTYKTGSANVYTGFKEDIVDYTIAGYWLYLLFIGFICGFFFYKAQLIAFSPHGVFFVILGKLYYPIMIYFYTDDFYSLTGVDFLVPLFLLILFNNYIKRNFIYMVSVSK